MQTLGLSDSTPRTESRWRALLWPTIRNEGDFDYITRQGFWVCSLVAAATLVLSAFTGSLVAGVFQGLFFFLAALGVRERSGVAAIVAFSAYFLSVLVAQRLTGAGFGIVPLIFLALLFANIRGSWVSARWEKDLQPTIIPMRLSETIGDKLADRLPTFLWPKVRHVFYVLAVLEIAALVFTLFAPIKLLRSRS